MAKQLEGIEIKSGDFVLIPKGTPIFADGEWVKSKRSHRVKVSHLLNGYTSEYGSRPDVVVWAGSGGYWKECDVRLVEKVD